MDLFSEQERAALARNAPLATRMRPRTLDEFVGQEHILASGRLLRRMLDADRLRTAILCGPPGCGKTTLARLVAEKSQARFEWLNATSAGVKDVRAIGEAARQRLTSTRQRTVLFIDEIHRFNRGQQDALLADVEEGVLTLIGATTENPYFSVNGPLLSRSTIFALRALSADQIAALCRRALADSERGLAAQSATCDDDALLWLAEQAEGDARRALNALEIAVASQLAAGQPPHVTLAIAADSMQRKIISYDASGDLHYDVTSAFIKSMRGSDPDAAIYWLARMLEAGEDPRFIARRVAICASEDVGCADPTAVLVAAAAVQVTELVGVPECEYALAQAAVHIACAPKSNAVALAISEARREVRERPVQPVPIHLRDASYPGAARRGHGAGYVYAHEAPGGVSGQAHMDQPRVYYRPTDRGAEAALAARLEEFRRLRAAAAAQQRDPLAGRG
ncbi:MAG: putative AAA domain-containing protein [Phycisphaerae bacterium]|nr:putative AAA domain-containing protein [Phycisphaerae bacterium]